MNQQRVQGGVAVKRHASLLRVGERACVCVCAAYARTPGQDRVNLQWSLFEDCCIALYATTPSTCALNWQGSMQG